MRLKITMRSIGSASFHYFYTYGAIEMGSSCICFTNINGHEIVLDLTRVERIEPDYATQNIILNEEEL